MAFNPKEPTSGCTVCGADANIVFSNYGVGEVVNCSRCGDYRVSHIVANNVGLPFQEQKKTALVSHLIRGLQKGSARAELTGEFFKSLAQRNLPSPSEVIDNLLLWFGDNTREEPGTLFKIEYGDVGLQATIGVVSAAEIDWILDNLIAQGMVNAPSGSRGSDGIHGNLTLAGWTAWERLTRGRKASNFAFFARRFENEELDRVYEECLRPSALKTGYELRIVTQKAGSIDAVMEDEIRRCRFLIADLTDHNAGAYWEAGLAEGLGKPVIYICKNGIKTHFDTNHRQTVFWDLGALDQTEIQLKAVIRNTLLGDAKQED